MASPLSILKVRPEGKLLREAPYLSIMSWISEDVPATINSILPRFWNATELVDQVVVSVLSKLVPERAPMYSSQVNWILSPESDVLVILFI